MGCSGAGALFGSIALAMRSSVKGLGRWVAVSAAAFGAALAAFALSKSFVLSAVLLVPVGGAMMVQMASSNTLIQSMVPDALRGRVMSVYSMMFMGMGPLGSLLAGSVAQRTGAPVAVAAGGVLTIVAAAIFFLRLPNLRGEATRLIVAQQYAGGDPAEEQTATGAEA
jgi:MFS family permease